MQLIKELSEVFVRLRDGHQLYDIGTFSTLNKRILNKILKRTRAVRDYLDGALGPNRT